MEHRPIAIDWLVVSETMPADSSRVMCSGPGWVAPDCLFKDGSFYQRVDNEMGGEHAYRTPTKDPSDPKLERLLPAHKWMWGPRLFPSHWAPFPQPAQPIQPSPGGPAPDKKPSTEEQRPISKRIAVYLGSKSTSPDKESIYQLQLIDTNCNDCAHLRRRFGPEAIAAKPNMFYGDCSLKGCQVTFVPMSNMFENASCFVHRKDAPKR